MDSLKPRCSSQLRGRGMHGKLSGRHAGFLTRSRTRKMQPHGGAAKQLQVRNMDSSWSGTGSVEIPTEARPADDVPFSSIRANSMIELRSKLAPSFSPAAAKFLATDPNDFQAAVPYLLQLCETHNERVKLLAVETVRDIACTPTLQLKLAEAGAAKIIANLLIPPKYNIFWLQTISKAGAEALSAMCYAQPAVKAAIADSGAIPHLVELASIYQTYPKNGNSFDKGRKLEAAGLAATRVLCSLADAEDVRPRLLEEGATSVLTKMLDEEDNPALAYKYAAATLAKISVGC